MVTKIVRNSIGKDVHPPTCFWLAVKPMVAGSLACDVFIIVEVMVSFFVWNKKLYMQTKVIGFKTATITLAAPWNPLQINI